MMKKLSLATTLFMLCLFAAPLSASAAYSPYGNVCDGNSGQSAVCTYNSNNPNPSSSNPLTGKNGWLAKITNIVSYAGGAAAVIIMIISGLRFVTSGSDVSTGSRTDTDVENAKRSIANAVIGLVVIILARTLILFTLKRL